MLKTGLMQNEQAFLYSESIEQNNFEMTVQLSDLKFRRGDFSAKEC